MRVNEEIQRLFAEIEQGITDPRKPNGIRHPCVAIIKLVVVGLMCRLVSIEQIAALGRQSWHQLKPALGFTHLKPPHATTISRLLGRIEVDQLSKVFTQWMAHQLTDASFSASVDGKTANSASNEEGGVCMMVNLFAHQLNQSLAGLEVETKSGEPTVLKKHLKSLFESYPGLKLLTGDAYYTGRTLCQAIVDLQRDYLVAVKRNAGELHEAVQYFFAHQPNSRPAGCDVSKKGNL